MSILSKIKPKFWDHHDVAAGSYAGVFNFRRKWKLIVLLTSIISLTPLVIMTYIDYRVSRQAMEAQLMLRTSRLVSNTWRTISFFLSERKSAVDFVLQDNTFQQLKDPDRLASILDNLKKGFGEFIDIAVVDASGIVQNYAGPHQLMGHNVCEEACFKQVIQRGTFISTLEIDGLQKPQQLVMATKHIRKDQSFFILRVSVASKSLYRLLSQLEIGELDDAFIIDNNGVLQTPSRFHGRVQDKIELPVPPQASNTQVIETVQPDGKPLIIGYAWIPDTPFILMVLRDKAELKALWYKPRIKLLGFLILSMLVIICSILGMATYLVHRIHAADQKRISALHQVEYANKLASIERLAAGLAHEINNPLAVINQKSGLMRDLIQLKSNPSGNEKLLASLESISRSVDRCGKITRRLLNFARHIDVSIQPLDIGEIVQGMVDVISKEAELRHIQIQLEIPDSLPLIQCDESHLQQILLNIINNSFAAIKDHGKLNIVVELENSAELTITIVDNGCGIPEEDLKHVFEPFFTTKTQNGGTGLGLSITYGLIQNIGGRIDVKSAVGEGTRFVVTLPIGDQEIKHPMKDLGFPTDQTAKDGQ